MTKLLRPQWLDRSLVVSPYRLLLCTRPGQFRRRLRKLGIKRRDWPEFAFGARAAVHELEAAAGAVLIVCVKPSDRHTGEQHAALLVHEAVHCWQRIRDRLGERCASREFEAYSIQSLAQELFVEYARQVEAKGHPGSTSMAGLAFTR